MEKLVINGVHTLPPPPMCVVVDMAQGPAELSE